MVIFTNGWFLLAIILLFEKLKVNKKINLTILILFICYLSFLTVLRNLDWRDPITFYEKNLTYTPNSFIQHNNLGMAYSDVGRIEDAIKEYKTAISIADIYPQVHYNLGNAFASIKKFG